MRLIDADELRNYSNTQTVKDETIDGYSDSQTILDNDLRGDDNGKEETT